MNRPQLPLSFFPLNAAESLRIRQEFGSPVFVYDAATIDHQIRAALDFPNAFGLTVRYAMKANPNAHVLRRMLAGGLSFDASSGFEAQRAIKAGIPAERISVSAQEFPHDLDSLVQQGVQFVATSLHQLESWGERFPGSAVTIRFNPGLGSGHNQRTNVGGVTSSFGIWHELLDDVRSVLDHHQLELNRIHTHSGSGGDPRVWRHVATASLALVEQFESVTTLDVGGGFRVARMPAETVTELASFGEPIRDAFAAFANRTGRRIHLEIEPGSYLMANSGILLATVVDIVSTGSDGNGFSFLRTNTGMTEILRPAMYGAQHPMTLIRESSSQISEDDERDYVVVGHCCESGDILTPAQGDPETIATRRLPRATIGDLLVIGGAGLLRLDVRRDLQFISDRRRGNAERSRRLPAHPTSPNG